MCAFDSPHDPRLDALRPLDGEGVGDVLPRLVEGDPMELLEVCARYLAEEALMLDLGRLHSRSLAIVARRAAEAGEEDVEAWLGARVGEAADQLMYEEQLEERMGFPAAREDDPRSVLLMEALGIEPAMARGVSVSFHRMNVEGRKNFWRAVVAGEGIDGIAEEEGSTREGVLSSLRGVIRSMSLSGASLGGASASVVSESEPGDTGQENA